VTHKVFPNILPYFGKPAVFGFAGWTGRSVQRRTKELINRGCEKISPERVEQVLMSFPGVADAAVFAIPDDVWGERVAAVILPRNGFHVRPTDLTSYCRDRLAPFEIPERIAFADQLPLTPKGRSIASK